MVLKQSSIRAIYAYIPSLTKKLSISIQYKNSGASWNGNIIFAFRQLDHLARNLLVSVDQRLYYPAPSCFRFQLAKQYKLFASSWGDGGQQLSMIRNGPARYRIPSTLWCNKTYGRSRPERAQGASLVWIAKKSWKTQIGTMLTSCLKKRFWLSVG